jgi:histone demethylase JARID1
MLGSKDMPTLDDAQSLIREGNTIPIILDGFDVLSEAANTTKTWLDNAQPCLKGKQLTRRGVSNPIPPLSEAQNLLKTSKDLKLFIKEVELLEERVEAAEEWDVDAKDAIKRWREEGAEVTLGELELSHEDFGLELPAMAMVRIRINSLKWEERVRKIIAPKAKLVEDTVLDELRAEADELKDLDEELLAEIVKRHTLVDEWRKKADRLLDPPPLEDGRLAPSASPDEIDALIAEGKALPADVSKVEDLEASLADHAVWVEAVRKCLNSVAEGRPRPPMNELYDLLAEVEDLTFKCSERQALTNACTAATAWTEKLNCVTLGCGKGRCKA